jgi:hypothetical protein
LIWHQDASIRSELMSSFTQVFLTDGAREHAKPSPPYEIAINLMRLIQKCSSNELISLEAIVAEVLVNDHTDIEKVIACLIEKARNYQITIKENQPSRGRKSLVGGLPVTEVEASSGGVISDLAAALYAMSMIFGKITFQTKEVISLSVLNNLIYCGLGPIAIDTKDYFAIKVAASCLQKIFPIFQEEEGGGSPLGSAECEEVFSYAMDGLNKITRLPLDPATYHDVR